MKWDQESGKYFLIGSFLHLTPSKEPIGFVFVVYWDGKIGDELMQHFVLRDSSGNVLDETPKIQHRLKREPSNFSTASFYTIFSSPGRYNIEIYQDNVCTDKIPLDVIETDDSHR